MSSPAQVAHPAPSDYPTRSTARSSKIAGVVVLGAIMSILDITVVNVALPTLQHTFAKGGEDLAYSTVAWTVTAYTLALATVIPLTGWAADRFGTKRLYMLASFFHRSGSVLCASASADQPAHLLSRSPGPRWWPPHAARHDDHDPRRGPEPDGPADGHPRCPDVAGPDPRPDSRWLISSRGQLALDLPHQPPARPAGPWRMPRGCFRTDPSRVRSLRLPGHADDESGSGDVPVGISSIPGREPSSRPGHGLGRAGLALMVAFVIYSFKPRAPAARLAAVPNRTCGSPSSRCSFAAAFFGGLLLVPTYFQQVRRRRPARRDCSSPPGASARC